MNDRLDSLFAVVDSLSQSVGPSVQQISHDVQHHCQTLSDRVLSLENMITHIDIPRIKEDVWGDSYMSGHCEPVPALPKQPAVCDVPTEP